MTDKLLSAGKFLALCDPESPDVSASVQVLGALTAFRLSIVEEPRREHE